jgi:UDP-glucose 4-epimerase
MKILVTGGAGYIGSHVVKHLGDFTNHHITVIDNLSTGYKQSVLYGNFIDANLSDALKLDNIFKNNNFDVVMHFAASIVAPESVENPLKYYQNNTMNTLNLIGFCIKYNVKKFVFSSTAAVYGENNTHTLLDETITPEPINPYGMSKLMSENILKDVAKVNKDFKYIILRYFNVAGADTACRIGQFNPKATHLIKVAAEAATGKRNKVYIYGNDYDTKDGTGIRDYIHIDDIADAHLKTMEYLEEGDNNIFNCGYGLGYSVMDVIDTMKKLSGNDFDIEVAARRPGDSARAVADNTKILQQTNWKPRYNSLDVICKSAYEWEKHLKEKIQTN